MRNVPTTLALVASFLTVCAFAASARADGPLVPAVRKPKVEIVFAIDTTGSMGGLIDGAKRKIWSIANEVSKAQQKPEVRIGLVAFRDRGDEYVTRVTPMTNDLDQVYEALMALRADGGGDTPEDVNAGLAAALHEMKWSQGKDTLKMIFLVGDAPPHMDYQGQVRWQRIAREAVRKNIYINTVQCGVDGETTTTWKAIAHAAEGRFAQIPQDGGVRVAVDTPYDAELRRLASELDGTYLEYGSRDFREGKKAARTKAGALASAEAPASVAADRASFKAASAPKADQDLIDLAAARGGAGAALESVRREALPEELKGKSAAEQRKVLEDMAKKRGEISKQIATLSKKREAHIEAERTKAGAAAAKDSFDSEVVDALHAQAASVGLSY
jgi:Mg-chelatase subunit ChlD